MVVVVVVLVVALGNKASGGDIFLASDTDPGANAFTPNAGAPPPARVTAPSLPPPAQQGAVAGAVASQPGLYGGTLNTAGCDVAQLVDSLTKDPAKADAFASVPRIRRDQIPAYVNSLTPVILQTDTRVTSHGFGNGQATSFQAALQAGTTALVDTRGSPRVRCTGGNPLTAPVAVRSSPTYRGTRWPGFSPTTLVVIDPSTTVIDTFVLVDVTSGQRFSRPAGSQGDRDASS